jgi:ABC-2 type transport system permease protein
MSATTYETPTLDVSGTPRIPLTGLTRVELRKLVDTRASRWLLIAIGLITAAAIGIFFFAADQSDRVLLNFIGFAATPQAFLLPVLGILLITSEWSQRTALVTFTLMPVRGRVLLAKVIAALIAGLLAIAVAMGVAALATVAGGAENAWVDIGVDDFAKFGLLQVTGVLQGLAFGLLFLNSAAAIVSFFVLPTVFSIVANVWDTLRDAAPWVDLATAQTPLFEGGANLSGEQWWQVVVTTLIWVVLPFAVGLVRVLRAEVK